MISVNQERRAFVKRTLGAGAALLLNPLVTECSTPNVKSEDGLITHIFSKHLQFLNYRDMADAAAELGFDGVDLTVRPKGHVEPEKVMDDLPLAVEAIKKAGLRADMMVTRVTDADQKTHKNVLKTAASQGVKYYRMGYLNFHDDRTIPQSLEHHREVMLRLAEFNRSLNLMGAYQNHAGMRVGAEIWDLWHLMKDISPSQLGVQYDVRHAMVEGGTSWENGLRLIEKQITSIVLKDYIWKRDGGKWKVVNVPLGEGMVDWINYFKLLKSKGITVPVTIHYEYDLGGVEHGDRTIHGKSKKEIFGMMKKDLELAKRIWSEA